jgi:ParB family chromosome partitioning protein
MSIFSGHKFEGLDSLLGAEGAENEIMPVETELLDDFPNHPFSVKDDEDMDALTESVKECGILEPLTVRKAGDRYEIISGHRRRRAAVLCGLETVPVIVREMSNEDAIIRMVDSNLRRETILPSERGWAYRLKADALKHQGKANESGLSTAEEIGQADGRSGESVRQYIRLTYLINALLNAVDNKRLPLKTGVELSYLDESAQEQLFDVMLAMETYPKPAEAAKLRELAEAGELDQEAMELLIIREAKPEPEHVKVPMTRFRHFFSADTDKKQVENTIFKALTYYEMNGMPEVEV